MLLFARFFAVALLAVPLICQAQTRATDAARSADPAMGWERWTKLRPADPDLEPGGLLVRADCDAEALYVRFAIEAWLPYQLYAENEPAWRFDLILADPTEIEPSGIEEEGEDKVHLSLSLTDDGRRDYQLDNGVSILETEEQNGSQRIELRIPRSLIGESIPWNADGPAVDLAIIPRFELANHVAINDGGSSVLLEVIEIEVEEDENAAPEEPIAAPSAWPAGFRFALGWDKGQPEPAILPAFDG